HYAQAQSALGGRNAFFRHGRANALDRALGHLQATCGGRLLCSGLGLRRKGALSRLRSDCYHVVHSYPCRTCCPILARFSSARVGDRRSSYWAWAAAASAVSATPFFFFQSPIAARMASSASTEQ